jgi:hypothetical protein
MPKLRLKNKSFTQLKVLEGDIGVAIMRTVGRLRAAEGKRVYKWGTAISLLRETRDKVHREINRMRRTGRYR